MQQVEFAADIAETRYDDATTHTLVWLFDQSSRHRKMDELALVSSKVLVKDGGPRRVRETTWAGQPQPMVNGGGMTKGLTTILRERGINTHNMRADDMRVVLQNHEDFRTEKSIVEHYLLGRGHLVFFLPKFHCELQAIERVWG